MPDAMDPAHDAAAAQLTMDLAAHLTERGIDPATMDHAAWQAAYQAVRPVVRLRPTDASPSADTRRRVIEYLARRADPADADVLRGFPT